MKTSNKLLTGLLVAVFLIPLGIMMAFNQMIKGDNYTTVRKHNNYIINKKTGDYSVVKITVPDFKETNIRKILTCHLHSAKDGYYTFRKINGIDSVSVINERDTLFIKYVVKPHPHSTPVYYVYYNINLYLPDMKNIVVNRATVQMDSIDTAINPEINIRLKDATFQMGDGIDMQNSNNPLKDIGETSPYKTMLEYNNLSIRAETSQLVFGYHLRVDSLFLNIAKDSRLTIANDFQAGKMEGSISNQATIVSNMGVIKKLSGLKGGKD